jgi:hypothetical protein
VRGAAFIKLASQEMTPALLIRVQVIDSPPQFEASKQGLLYVAERLQNVHGVKSFCDVDRTCSLSVGGFGHPAFHSGMDRVHRLEHLHCNVRHWVGLV